MVQSGSLGIRHKFETPISIPNLLHHSVAVWPEGNCLTSLRLNFLICELRVIMITLYRDAVRLGYIASICGSTLLAYFLILIIGDTNDLKGHLTWWMPPSLNPPQHLLPCPTPSRFSLLAPLPADPPQPRLPGLEAVSSALGTFLPHRVPQAVSQSRGFRDRLFADKLGMGWLGACGVDPGVSVGGSSGQRRRLGSDVKWSWNPRRCARLPKRRVERSAGALEVLRSSEVEEDS